MRRNKPLSREDFEFLKSWYGNQIEPIEAVAKRCGLAVRTIKNNRHKVTSQNYESYNTSICKNGKSIPENIEFVRANLGKMTIYEIGEALGLHDNMIRYIIRKNNLATESTPNFYQIKKARKEAEKKALIKAKKASKPRTVNKENNREKSGRIARVVEVIRQKEQEKVRLGKIVETLQNQVQNEKMRIMIGRDTFYISPEKYNTKEKINAFIAKQEAKQRQIEAKFNKL